MSSQQHCVLALASKSCTAFDCCQPLDIEPWPPPSSAENITSRDADGKRMRARQTHMPHARVPVRRRSCASKQCVCTPPVQLLKHCSQCKNQSPTDHTLASEPCLAVSRGLTSSTECGEPAPLVAALPFAFL